MKTAPRAECRCPALPLFPLCARRAFVWGCWHVQSPRRREQRQVSSKLADKLGGSWTACAAPCPLLGQERVLCGSFLQPGAAGGQALGARGFWGLSVGVQQTTRGTSKGKHQHPLRPGFSRPFSALGWSEAGKPGAGRPLFL